jgi:RNA polymerase sigma factor (sigma-70 family)
MQQDYPPDETLIQKYQQLGDIESLDCLFQRYLKKTYSFFLRQINNRDDVGDLVQDVFVKITRKINSGELINSFQDYLFICCRHTFLDYLRQKKSAVRFQSATTSDGKNAVALVSFSRWLNSEAAISIPLNELEQAIESCIASFPSEKVRNILSDYVHGYSLKEIVGRRDCPLGTAGSIWHRNKDRLLQCILKKIGRL